MSNAAETPSKGGGRNLRVCVQTHAQRGTGGRKDTANVVKR